LTRTTYVSENMDLLLKGSGPSNTSTNNTPTMLTPATTRRSLSPVVPPEKKWGNGIDLETSSSDYLNDYIRWRIDTYEGRKWRNDTLSEIFALDFEHSNKRRSMRAAAI